jgi:hypothetical protein
VFALKEGATGGAAEDGLRSRMSPTKSNAGSTGGSGSGSWSVFSTPPVSKFKKTRSPFWNSMLSNLWC